MGIGAGGRGARSRNHTFVIGPGASYSKGKIPRELERSNLPLAEGRQIEAEAAASKSCREHQKRAC